MGPSGVTYSGRQGGDLGASISLAFSKKALFAPGPFSFDAFKVPAAGSRRRAHLPSVLQAHSRRQTSGPLLLLSFARRWSASPSQSVGQYLTLKSSVGGQLHYIGSRPVSRSFPRSTWWVARKEPAPPGPCCRPTSCRPTRLVCLFSCCRPRLVRFVSKTWPSLGAPGLLEHLSAGISAGAKPTRPAQRRRKAEEAAIFPETRLATLRGSPACDALKLPAGEAPRRAHHPEGLIPAHRSLLALSFFFFVLFFVLFLFPAFLFFPAYSVGKWSPCLD